MTTTPARKSCCGREAGLPLFPSQCKARRRPARRAFRSWLHLTRCYRFFHRRSTASALSLFKSLRRAFGAAFLALWLPSIVHGETFMVTSNSDTSAADDAVLTLREAITLANERTGPDIITFAETLSGEVLTLKQGELAISDELDIDATSLADAFVIDADRKSRVMHFTASEGDLKLTKLTLRGGSEENGGGIQFASGGTLTLTSSTIRDNQASGEGGGISTRTGTITLNNSTADGNVAGALAERFSLNPERSCSPTPP